ncbi:MAG: ISAs1 family transposase [Caldilineaceae bacterium SB0665_bin_21]|nr:ISAs1 family transposase [Caldilineaceae bacterium SB0665_bin_21]
MKAALWRLDGTSRPGLEALILALDGKAAARSGDRAAGIRALHMVSAFLVREGLTLAQEPCDAKSNEIAAIPRWLDRIHLKGAVVTMDAAGCQTAIVQALREAGADYVLAVKRNQPTLHREVKAAFDDAERGVFRPADSAPSATTSRAGLRMRKPCWSWSAATGGGNGLHRTLDVQFREDDCRMRSGHAPAVMGILRRTALNMLRTIQRKLETDVSIGLLRDRIGRQPWILADALP